MTVGALQVKPLEGRILNRFLEDLELEILIQRS